MRYQDFKNGVGDRAVWSAWVWDELASLRGSTVHNATQVTWKKVAGCVTTTGNYPHHKEKVDQRHYFTPREAATIMMLGLWTDVVRPLVQPDLRVGQIDATDVPRLFDTWVSVMGTPEWKKVERSKHIIKLMHTIWGTEQLTYGDLLKAKKEIPRRTIGGWVLEAGGKFRQHEPCPQHVWGKVAAKIDNWKPRGEMRSSHL